MRLLSMKEVERISNDWAAVSVLPIPVQNKFYDRLRVSCTVVMPLGELSNPNISGHVWVWKSKRYIHPEDITKKHRFNANGLEGCFSIESQLSTALLIYRHVSPDRINIFVDSGFKWVIEEREFLVRWVHTGHYEATYCVVAKSQEEADTYVAEHRLELEPIDVFPLSDGGAAQA